MQGQPAAWAPAWSSDGFGAAGDHGVPLPALVLALRTTPAGADLNHRFGGGRRWLALEHRMSDRASSEYLTAIITVIEPSPAALSALRQIPLLLPERSGTVGHMRSYSETIATLFGAEVSVADQHGPVGGR